MMVANPKLVDVAWDWPGDQGCALTGDGDAACRLPDPTDKWVGWVCMVPSVFSHLGLVGPPVALDYLASLVVVCLSLCQLLCECLWEHH